METEFQSIRLGVINFANTKINSIQNTQFLIHSQLEEFHSLHLSTKISSLHYYIVLTVSDESKDQWDQWITQELSFLQPKTVVLNTENIHEYLGIHLLWKLGHQEKRFHFFLYFHSKGITRIQSKFHCPCEKDTFNKVLSNAEFVLFIFLLFPSIQKIGVSSSHKEWM